MRGREHAKHVDNSETLGTTKQKVILLCSELASGLGLAWAYLIHGLVYALVLAYCKYR